MRLHRLALALLGAVVPLAVAPAFVAPASAADPTPPAESAPAAVEVLEHAKEVLQGVLGAGAGGHAGHPGEEHVEATLALLELRKALPQLDPADRRTARHLMARPDVNTDDPKTFEVEDADKANGAAWNATEKAAAQVDCSDGRFCVHWIPAGTQVKSSSGTLVYSRHNATQAEVDQTIAAMKLVWDRETGTEATGGLGFREPLGDGARGGSGFGRLDVYLADTGDEGIFGYAVPEGSTAVQTSAGYLVLDNDFSEFTDSTSVATGLRQVTAAHEFFHLVQFAYDADESWWLMESTATWVEEQVYDDVNDNRFYLRVSSLRKPSQPLDTFDASGAQYGNWVFHQLVSERHGTMTLRSIWDSAAARRGDNARSAMDTAYRRVGSTLAGEFRMFTGASLAPSRYWEEGEAYYPAAQMRKSFTLGTSTKSTGDRSASIDHLAAADFTFRPDASLTGAWKLRLRVDGPVSGNTGYVMVVYKGGRIGTGPLTFDSAGNVARSFPFSASEVSRVAVTLGNSTTADNRVTRFRGEIWR